MFSALLERVPATPLEPTPPAETRASPAASIVSTLTVDVDVASDPQSSSSSSTPPTSIGDGASISSTSLKLETTAAAVAPSPASATPDPHVEPSGRSRRARASVGTYNVKVLSGTAIHAPRKYLKNPDGTPLPPKPRRRTISGDTLVEADQLIQAADEAFNPDWSVAKLSRSKSQIGLAGDAKKIPVKPFISRRKSMLSTSDKVVKKISVLGKRSRQTLDDSFSNLAKVPRELRKLQDTPEFAKIETKPVIHEVWSNGKLVTEERPNKKKKAAEVAAVKQPAAKVEEPAPPEPKTIVGKRDKTWLPKGLYAGQLAPAKVPPKVYKSPYSSNADTPEEKPRSILPMPLFHGERLVELGRDFKLPFDICSPLPPGQPKPDEWRKTSSSKSQHLHANLIITNSIFKIASLVTLLLHGRKLKSLTASRQNVSAQESMGVMNVAKTASCFTSVMKPIARLVATTAVIVPLPNFQNAARLVESTESESRFSKLLIEVMV